MSIILFLVVLFVLVLVHEWGHYITAKKTGMKVEEFGIGFPPKAWSFTPKNSETEYTLNWLPIGGFVRILGENPMDEAQIAEADKSRTFAAKPKWAQAVVLIAGVVMNILFAWLLFSITAMIGVPTAIDEAAATENSKLYIASILADSPADGALPLGAEVLSVGAGDAQIDRPNATEFSTFIAQSNGVETPVSYFFQDKQHDIALTPTQGLSEEDPERYMVGTALTLVEIERLGLFAAIGDGFMTTIRGLEGIVVGLWTLISQSVSGEADFSQVTGPVGIVGLVSDAAAFGLTALLTFTAIISLNLAVINLLPFPALDGGRLVFVAIEAVTGKEIPPAWAGRVNFLGFALLMLLMILVTYNDVLRLL